MTMTVTRVSDSEQETLETPVKHQYFDIAVNLTDHMYKGVYRGKKQHECDISNVLQRAVKNGCSKMLMTGTSITESIETIQLCNDHKTPGLQEMYTIGVHPTSVNEFLTPGNNHSKPIEYTPNLFVEKKQVTKVKLQKLWKLWNDQYEHDASRFKSIGEMGLDKDRLNHSAWECQEWFFHQQLKLACLFLEKITNGSAEDATKINIPFFLHERNCCDEFIKVLQKYITGFYDTSDDLYDFAEWALPLNQEHAGTEKKKTPIFYKLPLNQIFVIHSYTDTPGNLPKLLAISENVYIGLNGCSLRESFNIDTVEILDLDKILVETDAPWCEIRKTSASSQYVSSKYSDDPNVYAVKSERFVKKVKELSINAEDDNKENKNSLNVMVKDRNEPCNVDQVVQVISNIKEIDYDVVASTVWETSLKVYQ